MRSMRLLSALLLFGSAAGMRAQLANALSPAEAQNGVPTASIQEDSHLRLEKTAASPSNIIPAELTLQEAEQIALRNNPRIRAARLLAQAEHQVYREQRADILPQIDGGAVGAKANSGSRFTFDGLRSTRLLTHAGGGLTMNQLLFDFGRTPNLIASARLREKAEDANALASRMDVVLVTDQLFYRALEAQALVQLAQQTVATRNTTNRLVSELTKNKLRSDVDLAFSEENVAQATLLLLNSQTEYRANINALTAVLGFDQPMQYRLAAETSDIQPPPPEEDALVRAAVQQRPDLLALNDDAQAAEKYSRAEHEQLLPTIGISGVVGGTPVRTDEYFTSNWFGAVGVTLQVPIFEGYRDRAEASEASLRARAAGENLRNLRNNVVRDVRNAWEESNASYQKISATEEYLHAANLGLDLAQARYKLGLSSIVELSQAQLAQTQASIENVNARYEYELSLAALNYQLGALP